MPTNISSLLVKEIGKTLKICRNIFLPEHPMYNIMTLQYISPSWASMKLAGLRLFPQLRQDRHLSCRENISRTTLTPINYFVTLEIIRFTFMYIQGVTYSLPNLNILVCSWSGISHIHIEIRPQAFFLRKLVMVMVWNHQFLWIF